MPTITVSTNESRIRMFLGQTIPDGVSISATPPITKGINLNIDITFNVVVNLAEIGAVAFSAWLANRLQPVILKPGMYVNVNGKNLPENETTSKKLIEDEIANQEQRHSPTG